MAAIERFESGARMSAAVAHGDIVYLAGQVANDTSLDITGQTREVLAEIDRLLALAGSDKSKMLRCNIWLSDIAHFGAMNAVWDQWVDKANLPARATVESKLATPDYLVEIMVTAVR
jgi:enamine deaminase RidA (YjgF/YER057c/UK114 family)